eukprot:COSAG02_NODE_2746_length_8108_cov_37.665002_6_plen_91_part_00
MFGLLRGNYDEALRLYDQALKIKMKALGPDHASTATTLNNMAQVHDSQGNYDEALRLYDQALKIKMKALGPDHAATTRTRRARDALVAAK